MKCAGCERELVAHEVAVYEAFRLAALHAGVDPVVAGVCEDCAELPCCCVCDRPIAARWPFYACATTCTPGGRASKCCSAICLRIHAMGHHAKELCS